MSDKHVILVSDYEVATSSRPPLNSPHPSLRRDHIEPKITSISDDFESEMISETSWEEETSYSSRSTNALI